MNVDFMASWRSVKDDPPNEGDYAIVFIRHTQTTDMEIAKYVGGTYPFLIDGGYYTDTKTDYWMEIPPKPED